MLDLYYYFSNKRRLWIYFNDRRPTLEYCISRLIISYNLTFQKLSYQICQKKIGAPPKWENNNDRLEDRLRSNFTLESRAVRMAGCL